MVKRKSPTSPNEERDATSAKKPNHETFGSDEEEEEATFLPFSVEEESENKPQAQSIQNDVEESDDEDSDAPPEDFSTTKNKESQQVKFESILSTMKAIAEKKAEKEKAKKQKIQQRLELHAAEKSEKEKKQEKRRKKQEKREKAEKEKKDKKESVKNKHVVFNHSDDEGEEEEDDDDEKFDFNNINNINDDLFEEFMGTMDGEDNGPVEKKVVKEQNVCDAEKLRAKNIQKAQDIRNRILHRASIPRQTSKQLLLQQKKTAVIKKFAQH